METVIVLLSVLLILVSWVSFISVRKLSATKEELADAKSRILGLEMDAIQRRIDRIVEKMGVKNIHELWAKLDRGELEGTLAEVELRMIRFLEEGPNEEWDDEEVQY